jgi:E3 SUMO-protein ligase PIAS1
VIRTLKLSADLGFRLRQDPSLRLMLYAHTENALLPYAINDVAFPQQFEVKINNDEVRANYKGLKNKPGSTRPADLTDYVRKSPANYPNSVQITYALTQNVGTQFCILNSFYDLI